MTNFELHKEIGRKADELIALMKQLPQSKRKSSALDHLQAAKMYVTGATIAALDRPSTYHEW